MSSLPTLAQPSPTISFELMPPRQQSAEPQFWNTTRQLLAAQPDFLSVTYGAGGHNRPTAHAITTRLVREAPIQPLAHLTCVGASRAETTQTIDSYLSGGVRAFLALRGDAPQVPSEKSCEGELQSAIELIALVREREQLRCELSASNALRAAVRPLIIAVATFPAGNPAAGTTPQQEVERLLVKQAAGASFAITQLFYEADIYLQFVAAARAAGVKIPILAGILPPTHPQRLLRVAELTGIAPDPHFLRLLSDSDAAERQRIGIEAGAALARKVLESSAPGIHVYTFNQAEPTLQVLAKAGLVPPPEEEMPKAVTAPVPAALALSSL